MAGSKARTSSSPSLATSSAPDVGSSTIPVARGRVTRVDTVPSGSTARTPPVPQALTRIRPESSTTMARGRSRPSAGPTRSPRPCPSGVKRWIRSEYQPGTSSSSDPTKVRPRSGAVQSVLLCLDHHVDERPVGLVAQHLVGVEGGDVQPPVGAEGGRVGVDQPPGLVEGGLRVVGDQGPDHLEGRRIDPEDLVDVLGDGDPLAGGAHGDGLGPGHVGDGAEQIAGDAIEQVDPAGVVRGHREHRLGGRRPGGDVGSVGRGQAADSSSATVIGPPVPPYGDEG